MSIIVRRTIAVLAVLMLVGATAGCDREAGDEGVGLGDPGTTEQEGTALGDQDEMDDQEGVGEAPEPGMAGDDTGDQEQAVQEVQDEVSDELDIPASAVVIDEQVRQNITQATSDVERKGWGMVSTVERHLTNLNMDGLEDDEREAADELQQQVAEAQQSLQQMSQAGQDQAEEMESDLEDRLDEISDNWEEISDKLQIDEEPAAGGGPLDDQQNSLDEFENPMDDQQDMDQEQPQNY